jgi:hypothetical protein
MRKTLSGVLFLTVALTMLFPLLSSCRPTVASGNGSVRITVGTAQARATILPIIPAPSSYIISFSGPVSVSPITATNTSTTVELAAGTWTVSVLAYDANGAAIASGSLVGILVSAGTTTETSISLYAIASGSGAIDLTITWPSDQAVSSGNSSVSLTLGDASLSPTIVWGSHSLTCKAVSCPTGDYTLSIELKNSSNVSLYSKATDVVQVYSNLSTSATIALTNEDFTAVPNAPTNLSAAVGSSGIALTWTDKSAIETAYQVERSSNGIDYIVLLKNLPENSESYTDSSASSAGTYYYRICALNSVGQSPYSNVATASAGSLDLGIVVVSPTDQTITFSVADDVVVAQSGTRDVSISETFDSYKWILGTATISGATSNSVSISAATLTPGVHFLTAIVTTGGHSYSKSLRFHVNNGSN